MRKLILIAGAAAMAASIPALAEKGGKGGSHGGGGKPAAHGGGQGGGGKAPKAHGGGGGSVKEHRRAFHGGGGGKPDKVQRQAIRGGGKPDKVQRQAIRGGGKPDKVQRQAFRTPEGSSGSERRAIKTERKAARTELRREDRFSGQRADHRRTRDPRFDGSDRSLAEGTRSVAYSGAGCPPGLARKGNGCLPPGQAKKAFRVGERVLPGLYSEYNLPERYSAFYQDTQDHYYRYDDDGYIYRVDTGTDLVSALVPLLGGGFAVGQPLPVGYDAYNVPYQYRDDYYDTDESHYRYGDDAIYRVDSGSGIIESIVALLAGDLNVGEALPAGYDAYNLPLEYRDEYADTEEANYRYADGNIYQVDPETQLIEAIVEMIA
jgi:hypothetical protein